MTSRMSNRYPRLKRQTLSGAVALLLSMTLPAVGQEGYLQVLAAEQTYNFNIARQPLSQAITEFSAVTGIQVLYTDTSVASHISRELRGQFTPNESLQRLLDGSGLIYQVTGHNSITLVAQTGENRLAPIVVSARDTKPASGLHSHEEKRLNQLRPDLILSSEQMQRLPDEHLGKALDRLPGMFSTSPSEKQEVRVRGLDKEFTRIEMDGVIIPGSGRWRNLSLGSVATSLVDEVRVIRNPTADVEHDGIGGRVSIRYRRVPEVFEGQAQIMGSRVSEGQGHEMFSGQANVWAGGPISEGFGILGGLDINTVPSRREHQATQTNANGNFIEQFDRSDRKDVNRINAFTKFGWSFENTYIELEPMLMGDTSKAQDSWFTTLANGNQDNRYRRSDDRTLTYGANLRWDHEITSQLKLDGRLSGFRSDQTKNMDEERIRYQNNAIHRTDLSYTRDEMVDDLLELRNALSYDWENASLGKTEVGLQIRRNKREGNKSVEQNGVLSSPASGDEYTLKEEYLAGWLRHQFNLLDNTLQIEPGLRVEDYRLKAISNDGRGSNVHQGSDNLHIGPSLHSAWQINPELTLHGAVSRTQNRPQLNQITPSRRQQGNEIIVGNPELNSATSINTDLGLTWSSEDIFLATTLFHKDIKDLVVNAGTGEREGNRDVIMPINIEQGTLRGIEFEQRLHLGILDIAALNGLHLWSNQTLFDGRMRLKNGRTVRFFGEPDYLLAAGIDYISPSSGMQLALAINHNGKRTEEDEVSRKRFDRLTTVDFTAAYPISPDIQLRFEASNLFDEKESGPKHFYNASGNLLRTEYRTVSIPRIFSLGITARF